MPGAIGIVGDTKQLVAGVEMILLNSRDTRQAVKRYWYHTMTIMVYGSELVEPYK